MGFKEQVAADISSTFLNVGEFGATREIDGESIACALFDETLSPTGRGRRSEQGTDGVYVSESTLRVERSSLEAMPVTGQRMNIDGNLATVQAVEDEQGMLIILLRWFES
jgi:hypothetical protein